MIMHVVERAISAQLVARVIVATDDQRIADAVTRHGGEARLTSPEAHSGTDRVAEVAASLNADLIVNVQGDEPLIQPDTIDAAIRPLLDGSGAQISTTSEPITSYEDVLNPGVVKVVTDADGYALYFSRAPIPNLRPAPGMTLEQTLHQEPALLRTYRKHTGLYVYESQFLAEFLRMPPSRLERIEGLEQLRALENGYRIRVVEVEHRSIGVDTLQDYEAVKKMIEGSEQ
jgi:3-deoxy-manno-octulosonate cytidylyltransferase (CMP-KDO synthetase)